MLVVGITAFSVAIGFWVPRRSGIWIAALAWPLSEWLRLTHVTTSPPALVVLPAAFCALSAYAGVLLLRRILMTGHVPRG